MNQIQIPSEAPRIYVSFSAEINQSTTESLLAALAGCANAGVKEVYLLLSTSGGNVTNGMNLYNVMRGLPFKLTTHNVGSVDSIGNAIFLAGERRYACSTSTFMFHGVHYGPPHGVNLQEAMLNEYLGVIRADQTRISEVIQDRTSLTAQQLDGFFRESTTKDATFALNNGIVHEVREVKMSPGEPMVSLTFQR